MISKKHRKEREKETAGCLLTALIAFSVLHEESGNLDTLAQRSLLTFPNTQILYLSLVPLMKKSVKIKKDTFSKLAQHCLEFLLLDCTMFSESLVVTSHEKTTVNLLVNL